MAPISHKKSFSEPSEENIHSKTEEGKPLCTAAINKNQVTNIHSGNTITQMFKHGWTHEEQD